MYDFKFKVGDRVYLASGLDESIAHCKFGNASIPKCWTIIERVSQECPGGVQLHYKFRDRIDIVTVNEIEVGGLYSSFDQAQLIAILAESAIRQSEESEARFRKMSEFRLAAKEAAKAAKTE